MSSKLSDSVFWPTSTNPDGYHLDAEWRARQTAGGVLCANCGSMRPERLSEFRAVVVNENRSVGGHFGAVWGLAGVQVLSTEVVAAIGRERLLNPGNLVPVVTGTGRTIVEHVCLVGAGSGGTVRTNHPDPPRVCDECGRLKYWPGWPSSRWYLLRRYWDDRSDLMLINEWLLCGSMLWHDVIAPKFLRGVKGHKVMLIDEPTDALARGFFTIAQRDPKTRPGGLDCGGLGGRVALRYEACRRRMAITGEDHQLGLFQSTEVLSFPKMKASRVEMQAGAAARGRPISPDFRRVPPDSNRIYRDTDPVYREINPTCRETSPVYREMNAIYREISRTCREIDAIYRETDRIYREINSIYREMN